MPRAKTDAKLRIPRTSRDGESTAQKRLTSDRITADLADFEKAGGRVEVLGITRVLKKVDEPAAG
jgi:hypothetical protein